MCISSSNPQKEFSNTYDIGVIFAIITLMGEETKAQRVKATLNQQRAICPQEHLTMSRDVFPC